MARAIWMILELELWTLKRTRRKTSFKNEKKMDPIENVLEFDFMKPERLMTGVSMEIKTIHLSFSFRCFKNNMLNK